MARYGFLFIYPTGDSLGFLNPYFDVFQQFLKIFTFLSNINVFHSLLFQFCVFYTNPYILPSLL